jgi:hypothetical protein
MSGGEGSNGRPPAWARWYVGLFLAAFIVCGAAGIEAWPLTGFRLFSHARSPHQHTWQAFSSDTAGRETHLAFAKLPAGHGGFTLVMSRFDTLPPPEQRAICRAWASGANAAMVLIYRVDWDLLPRRNGRPAGRPVRTLVYRCDAETS